MKAIDLHDESVWKTDNQGAEYTVSVPCDNPCLRSGAVTVLMVCEGRAFTPEDRDHAQQLLDALPQRLNSIFARMMDLLGIRESSEFHAAKGTPTLMLEAGDHNRWIFALDSVPQDSSLFVEWANDQIVNVWLSG